MKRFQIVALAAFLMMTGSALAGPVSTITEADRAALQTGNLAMPAGVPLTDENGNFYGYASAEIVAKIKQAVAMGISERKAIREITGFRKSVPETRRTEFAADTAKALAAAVEVRDDAQMIWGLTTPQIAAEIEKTVALGIKRSTAIKQATGWKQPARKLAEIPVSAEVFAGTGEFSIPANDMAVDLSKPPVIETPAAAPATPDLDL